MSHEATQEFDITLLQEISLYGQREVIRYKKCLQDLDDLNRNLFFQARTAKPSAKEQTNLLQSYRDIRERVKSDPSQVTNLRTVLNQQNYDHALGLVINFLSNDPFLPPALKEDLKNSLVQDSYHEKLNRLRQYRDHINKKEDKRSSTARQLLSFFVNEAIVFFNNYEIKKYIDLQEKLFYLKIKKLLFENYFYTLRRLLPTKEVLTFLYASSLEAIDFRLIDETNISDEAKYKVNDLLAISLPTEKIKANCIATLKKIVEKHPREELCQLLAYEGPLEAGFNFTRLFRSLFSIGGKQAKQLVRRPPPPHPCM